LVQRLKKITKSSVITAGLWNVSDVNGREVERDEITLE
jgi:hypothetical protein